MRKFLLFGTMLGVAGTALAFGGVFSHGSKSTTYKGGVDAIGVHFGGEKKMESKESKEKEPLNCSIPYVANEEGTECICPTEKQCGDYCCSGDNICKPDSETGELQCCSESLDSCCSTGQSVYKTTWGPGFIQCCPGTIYCKATDSNGNCLDGDRSECCSEGKVVLGPLMRDNGEQQYKCCADRELPYCYMKFSYGCSYECCNGSVHEGLGPDGADLCCQDGKKPTCADYDSQGNCLTYTCCSDGETGYCSHRYSNGSCQWTGCCAAQEKPYCYRRNENNNCLVDRCGADSCTMNCMEEYDNGVCKVTSCCLQDETPFCNIDNDCTNARGVQCCPSGYIILNFSSNWYCCPEGATDSSQCL